MSAITRNAGGSLSPFDWGVVEIARKDGVRSINPDTGFARLLRVFFGFPVARGLANDRAEALRRFCVRAWYWDRIPADDVRPLIDAGFSTADLTQVLAHVAGRRGFAPNMQEAAT